MKRSSVNVLFFFDVRIDRPAKRNQSSINGLPVILQCITLILPDKLNAKLCVITEGDMTFAFSEFPASSSPSGRRYLTTACSSGLACLGKFCWKTSDIQTFVHPEKEVAESRLAPSRE